MTYSSYWNMVLGANRGATAVVEDFELTSDGLDEWLGGAEVDARAEAPDGSGPSEELCERWHDRALEELSDAVEAKATCQDCRGTGIGQSGPVDVSRCCSCGGSGRVRVEVEEPEREWDGELGWV